MNFNPGDVVTLDVTKLSKDHKPWEKAYDGIGDFKVLRIHSGKENLLYLELTEWQKLHFEKSYPQLAMPNLIHPKFMKLVRRAPNKFTSFYEEHI